MMAVLSFPCTDSLILPVSINEICSKLSYLQVNHYYIDINIFYSNITDN